MGTIVIEQYTTVGGKGAVGNGTAPVPNLKTIILTTVDATTSTTAESFTLNSDTRFVSVHGVEDHRTTTGTDKTTTAYAFIPAGQTRDFAVEGGETIYYRLNA